MSGVRTDASGNVILTANGVDAVKANTNGVITAGAPGVSGLDVVTVNQSFGVGQTWQNVLGSRASNTTYTNSTGKSIAVSIRTGVLNENPNITVAGVVVSATTAAPTAALALFAIVPNGATYSYTSGTAAINWMELR